MASFVIKGATKRRHVMAESYVLIGKEANKVGQSGEEEPGSSGQLEVDPLAYPSSRQFKFSFSSSLHLLVADVLAFDKPVLICLRKV